MAKGPDLAVVFGGAPAKGKPSMPAEESDEMPMMAEEESDDELDPAFESAITEAFPDMAGDAERMLAMKRAIKACY